MQNYTASNGSLTPCQSVPGSSLGSGFATPRGHYGSQPPSPFGTPLSGVPGVGLEQIAPLAPSLAQLSGAPPAKDLLGPPPPPSLRHRPTTFALAIAHMPPQHHHRLHWSLLW